MKTIRAGIIGTGFIGKLHIEAIMRIPGSTITAVCHHSGERLNAVKEQFNITRGYEDWRDLIDDPNVDVVHNCTPNHLHDEINRAAIMAGKHVYSEKPLSLNASNAFELYRLACEKGVAHGVNHQYRLNAAVQEMRERINGGECGRILFVRGHYLQESHAQKTDYSKRLIPETSPARALADIGTHWVDTVYCVTGKRIASVYADMHTHHPVRIDPATGKKYQSIPMTHRLFYYGLKTVHRVRCWFQKWHAGIKMIFLLQSRVKKASIHGTRNSLTGC